MPSPALPEVIINMAVSADGKIATANRRVNHFSSPADETHLYRLRADVDAVVNGARTVDTAPVRMDAGPPRFVRARLRNGRTEQPLRLVVTGSGSLDHRAEVFRHRFSPIIVLTTERCGTADRRRLEKVADAVLVAGRDELDPRRALRQVMRRWPLRRLLCEGGGALNDVFFRADLVEEVNLTVCPVVIGGREAPTLSDGRGLESLALAARFQLVSQRRRGNEMFLRYRRDRSAA